MTLQQLKYALTIADCGSMNEAAKTLFLSQPSLSETIRELETEIGFDLFVRSNRGILVTPEGEEFLGYARQVLEQAALLEDRYKGGNGGKQEFCVSHSTIHLLSMHLLTLLKSTDMMSTTLAYVKRRLTRLLKMWLL